MSKERELTGAVVDLAGKAQKALDIGEENAEDIEQLRGLGSRLAAVEETLRANRAGIEWSTWLRAHGLAWVAGAVAFAAVGKMAGGIWA